MRRIVFLKISTICLIFGLIACSDKPEQTRLPYYNAPDFTPEFFLKSSEALNQVSHTIGHFSFVDQAGKAVTDTEVEGKIHVANFIFTSCISICPVMTRHMKLLQKEFGKNTQVKMLSFSVTPWIDSVARLKVYAEKNQIVSPNWHLLTGAKGQIYDLARKSYFAEEDLGFTKDSTEFLHTEHIILVDKTKRIRGIYNGTLQLETEQLIRDVNALLKEGDL